MYMKSIESTYLVCLYIRQELLYFKHIYKTQSIGFFDFFMRLKPQLISLNNCKDFLDDVGLYIKDSESIVKQRKSISLHLECCKYLRNKVCGHLDDMFCEMALVWTPVVLSKLSDKVSLENQRRGRVDYFVRSLIESAINSYQEDNPGQQFFHGEIDMWYPDNCREFMSFITDCNDSCIHYN